MSKITTPESEVLAFRENIHNLLRKQVLGAIQIVVDEEISAVLGTDRYERSERRRGYRNGSEARTVITYAGEQTIQMPRGRTFHPDGSTSELRSKVLPKYARRAEEVDQAIIGVYLAGNNSRRIRKALAPLLGEKYLSKSSISRVVSRLKQYFAEWSERDLSEENYPILYLDGIHLKIRIARKVLSVPVLVALGVTETGEKRLVSMQLCVSEASVHWNALLEDLRDRGLAAPQLIIADGHKGLQKAAKLWPGVEMQRCTVHKKKNLLDKCPKHAHNELKRDYQAVIKTQSCEQAKKAYDGFISKWDKLCPGVANSMREGGHALLTFLKYPKALHRSLRSTNSLENLNREFRRRTKTQGSFTNEASALTLLYGLIAFGQIKMRKINGHHAMSQMIAMRKSNEKAA